MSCYKQTQLFYICFKLKYYIVELQITGNLLKSGKNEHFFASWVATNNGLDDRCNVRVSAQTRCQSTDMTIHYTNMANLVRYSIFICVEEDPKFHENHDFLNFAPTLFRSVLNTLECNINQYRYMLPYRTKSRVKTTQSCGSEF